MITPQDNDKLESEPSDSKRISDEASPIITNKNGFWGDEEDVSYEDTSPTLDKKYDEYIRENTDYQEQTRKSNETEELYNIHSILTQRYNQEIQRMYNFRSQAVFIITALGFLITLAVTVVGSDWFSLDKYDVYLILVIVVYLLPTIGFALYAGYTALTVIINIDKPEYCIDYPGQDLIDLSVDPSSTIQLNIRDQIRTLAFSIKHNHINNQKSRLMLKKSLIYLIVSLIYSIFILILVVLFGLI